MKHRKIVDNHSTRLILVFAGWGMDSAPFSRLVHSSYDIEVVWDYSDMRFPREMLEGYEEVCVIAWSFGVWVAAKVLAGPDANITKRIAVNGTMHPIDDRLGIPQDIFSGTLAGMDERNLQKFYRRMCGSRQAFAEFMSSAPERTLADLKNELRAYGEAFESSREEPRFGWDTAVIGTADMIFPAESQVRAWDKAGVEKTIIAGAAHLISIQEVIDGHIIDKDMVRRRFVKAAGTYDAHASVQTRMAHKLWRMAKTHISPGAASMLEVGCGSGLLSRMYLRDPDASSLAVEMWDIVDCGAPEEGGAFRCCDAESEIKRLPAESIDVILSGATLQWFNSPESFVARCARVLRPGGVLAFSTFGPDNYRELRALTGAGLHVPDFRHAARYLELSEYSEEHIALEFDSPSEVMRHMKATGVNALRGGAGAHSLARKIIDGYPVENGKCRLTYHPVYYILKKSL